MVSRVEYKGLYSIIGPPGTGKTTRLAKSVELAIGRGYRPLVASMTKSAEREVASRNIQGFDRKMVGTIHAHAYRAIGRPEVVKSSHKSEWNAEHPHYAMAGGDTDVDFGAGRAPGDKLAGEMDLLRHRATPREAWPTHVDRFATAWQDFKDQLGVIDFGDMIEIAYRESARAPDSPNVIFVDEAQDMSRIEYNLLKKWSRWANAMIITGDPDQALYVWRGADPSIFADPEIPSSHRDTLKQSYRVPKQVHRVATAWIKQHLRDRIDAEYLPRDEEGAVRRHQSTIDDVGAAVDLAAELAATGKTVMFCCAANYMVDRVTKALRDRSLPFANPWRKRAGWNPLGAMKGKTSAGDRLRAFLKPVTPTKTDSDESGFCWTCGNEDGGCDSCRPAPPTWTVADLWSWVKPCTAKGLLCRGMTKELKADVKRLGTQLLGGQREKGFFPRVDRADSYFLSEHHAFLASYQRGDVGHQQALLWYRSRLPAVGSDPIKYLVNVAHDHGVTALHQEPRLYVGTCHSFKGGESDVVFVFPDLPHAAYVGWLNGGESADSVARVFYVAMTRAREQLFICGRGSIKSVEIAV